MAPLSFDDRLNVASLVGTWLGSIFTLVGLLAVISQLRALLKDFSDHSQERLQDAAGDYAVCFKNVKLNEGVVEEIAPSVAGWIRHYYKNNNQNIVVTPFERHIAGGRASWSQLFARLQTKPNELAEYGGLDDHDSKHTLWSRHARLDLLVDKAKVSYGMDGEEFAAILILSSFSPSGLQPSKASSTTGHLGHICLGYYGPFSQIAQFDGSPIDLSKMQGVESPGKYAHQLNVRNCIDLALGIFRFECHGVSRLVTLRVDRIKLEHRTQNCPSDLDICFGTPTVQRVLAVRRNLVHLTKGHPDHDSLYDFALATDFLFHDMFNEGNWHISFPENLWEGSSIVEISPKLFETSMRIAVTVRALKPWGLPAIHPESLTQAICPLLQRTFPVSLNETIPLIRKFRELPQRCKIDIPGWTRASMDQALNSLSTVTSQNFSGLDSRCALYYDAMMLVFDQNGIDLGSVGTGLAAWCAVSYIYGTVYRRNCDESQWRNSELASRFRAALRERLNGSPTEDLDDWAYEILATYLIAWLTDSSTIDEDFRSQFRRRVFLG